MLPIPTSGDTMPPKAKPVAPNTADAVPALSRSMFIAIAVVDVNVNPIENNSKNSKDSYSQNGPSDHSTKNSASDTMSIPTLPVNVPYSVWRNFTDKAAATPIATELIAKNALNASAEKP